MSPDLEERVERIRAIIGDDPNITEKRMFGGLAFMLNGNMLCGYTNKGDFMVRVGKDLEAEARSLPGARDMDYTGKAMAGFLFIDEETLTEDSALARWIALSTRFVGTLPPK
ncbi:TfoX/Sxy family protein [Cucumibacter marinus]|uniref:TfoX/Sxy family protein n=1 Tax=Cucumibacter marinus TaxID=1121252 RepID=UPI00041ACC5E|nr:TfoX/Sxy family protein [Cucumibacter marinus]